MFFGVQGLPRQPGKAQEGSQEAPNKLQHLQQKDPKMSPNKFHVLVNSGTSSGLKSGTAASYNMINNNTRELQTERPPNKGAESTFMSTLLSAPEHEASIGIKAQPEVAADLEAMHHDLPMHSIVMRIARNLVLATSVFAITGESFYEHHEKIIQKLFRIRKF